MLRFLHLTDWVWSWIHPYRLTLEIQWCTPSFPDQTLESFCCAVTSLLNTGDFNSHYRLFILCYFLSLGCICNHLPQAFVVVVANYNSNERIFTINIILEEIIVKTKSVGFNFTTWKEVGSFCYFVWHQTTALFKTAILQHVSLSSACNCNFVAIFWPKINLEKKKTVFT